MLRFFVFRNVLIALCALCMAWETFYSLGVVGVGLTPTLTGLIPTRIWLNSAGVGLGFVRVGVNPTPTAGALSAFIFFSTFFVYNFHAFANHLIGNPFRQCFHLLDKNASRSQRLCVVIGFIGTVASFYFIPLRCQLLCLLFAAITLAYTLPLLKLKGGQRRLREVSFIKMFTVALVWAFITVLLPLVSYPAHVSALLWLMLFAERFIFIYAITIPFEIRDMEQEQQYGVRTIPAIIGIKRSKLLGYFLLVLFSAIALLHQYYLRRYGYTVRVALPIILSACIAAALIYFTDEKRNKWYFKGWIDGTMVIQFLLLLLFNISK